MKKVFMKKILLINQGNTTNYGDIAIKDTIQKFFETNEIDVDFCPFWDDKKIYIKKKNILTKVIFHIPYFLDKLYEYRMKKTLESIKEYDAIVIGGGELLCGHRGFNSALYVWSKYTKKNKKKLHLIGVSGDLEMPKYLIKRNKKAIKDITSISVRDMKTYNIVKENYNKSVLYYPDVVFSYNKVISQSKNKNNNVRNYILCVPIRYCKQLENGLNIKSEKEYFEYMSNLIKDEQKNVIITSTVNIDENTAWKFYQYLKEKCKDKNIEYKKYSNINDYIELINKSKIIISARMHALILGLINDCNIITIPFKTKLEIFKDEYEKKFNKVETVNNSWMGLEILVEAIKEGEKNE